MYMAYQCRQCGTVFIIPTEYIERMEKQKRYIACNFGHRNIEKLDKYDNLKECMQERSYKRENRRIKQIK